jgi:endonuclease I
LEANSLSGCAAAKEQLLNSRKIPGTFYNRPLFSGCLMFRFLFLVCFISLSYAQSPSSFSQSKKIAARLFQQHPQTIYCQCSYEDKEVNLASCSMQAADSIKRAHRIEWEHILRRFDNML